MFVLYVENELAALKNLHHVKIMNSNKMCKQKFIKKKSLIHWAVNMTVGISR